MKDTKVIKIDPIKPEEDRVREAAKYIKDGKLVIFPTETIYGIGANALDENACKEIFRIKGRPSENPLIVHVSSLAMAQEIAEIPGEYMNVIKRIWPSPITFIVKAKDKIPKRVVAGLETVAIRMPAHPVALELIKKSGVPIAAPSANPSGKPSATNATLAIKYFKGKVDCIIDSGSSFFGLESTILTLDKLKILRPGPFTREEIEIAFGQKPFVDDVARGKASAKKSISPGTKFKHYAPDTPLFLYNGDAKKLAGIIDDLGAATSLVFIGSKESCKGLAKATGCSTIELGPKANLYEIARNLFNGISLLDSMKVDFGIIESFDERGIGFAIMNRIRKASSGKSFGNLGQLSKYLEKEGY